MIRVIEIKIPPPPPPPFPSPAPVPSLSTLWDQEAQISWKTVSMGPGTPHEDYQVTIGQQTVPVQPKSAEIPLPI